MKGKQKSRSAPGQSSPLLRLLILALCFLSGVILGQVMAAGIPPSVETELQTYLRAFYEAEDVSASLLTILLLYLRYPVLAVLLGMTSAGCLLLPCLTAVYGFFLSFSVGCFTAAFGPDGILLSLAALGLRSFAALPCYFWLAVPAWSYSMKGKRQMTAEENGMHRVRLLLCLLVLLTGVLLEWRAGPWLLRAAMGHYLQ